MSSLKHLALASGLALFALAGAAPATAQTTDGFHAIQVFPIAVDSAAFTQRFTFKNPDATKAAEITVSFFPAAATPVACPNFTIPAKLAAAGVQFAISTGDRGSEIRTLPYNAGMAAAHGLSKTDALKAVTLWPAQVLGVADRLGSLEAGKMANVVVTTGDILEAKTDTKYLFIDGRPIPLDTKHTQLNTMFKDRP